MQNLKKQNIIFKKTLKEAADYYLTLKDKKDIQCVIIAEMAATTSHEATVMSSANMPVICLGKKMNDVEQANFLTISAQQGIVICNNQEKDFETVTGVASYALGEISKDLEWLGLKQEAKEHKIEKRKRKGSAEFKKGDLDIEPKKRLKEAPDAKQNNPNETELLRYFKQIQEVNPSNPSCLLKKSIALALLEGSKTQTVEDLASYAQNDNVKKAWEAVNRVLKMLGSKEQKPFQKMIDDLVEMNIFPTWLNTAFYESAKEKTQLSNQKTLIHTLVKNYTDNQKRIEALKQLIEEIDASGKDLFADPKNFDKNYKIFETLIKNYEPRVKNNFLEKEIGLIVKLLSIEYLNKLVDFVDVNIKSLTGSSAYKEQDKIDKFYQLLVLNAELLENVFHSRNLSTDYLTSMFKNGKWSKLGNKLIIQDANSVSLGTLEIALGKLKNTQGTLNPTPEFLVQDWIYSLGGDAQSYVLPKTLEDMFTLIHQNLIDQIQILNSEYAEKYLQKNQIISDFENYAKDFVDSKKTEPIKKKTQYSKEILIVFNIKAHSITDRKMSVIYNVPLYTHSGVMTFESDKKYSTLKINLFGTYADKEDAKARWGRIEAFSKDKDRKIKPKKTNSTTSEVFVEWKIPNESFNQDNTNDILETIFTMCKMTFKYK
jgi:phosphohistidine swiveling domain-containing protein